MSTTSGDDCDAREQDIERALAQSQREERAEREAALQRQADSDERIVKALSEET